jgi:hypothetical protein
MWRNFIKWAGFVKKKILLSVTLQLHGVYEDKELRNLMRFGG